jgi:hypothetical protein
MLAASSYSILSAWTNAPGLKLSQQIAPNLIPFRWRYLGYIMFDHAGAELLFQMLASRYETVSTLVTSTLMFSEWVEGIP